MAHIEWAWKFLLWVVITSHLDMVCDHDDTEYIPGAITYKCLGNITCRFGILGILLKLIIV